MVTPPIGHQSQLVTPFHLRGKVDRDAVKHPYLWPSMQSGQGCLVGYGQPWPEYVC